jgi:hypothetical protein
MLFNPMDLILLKELFYDVNSIPFNIVASFINKLLDLQNKTALGRVTEEEQNVLGALFFKKQEMIEFAYQIAKLNVFEKIEDQTLKRQSELETIAKNKYCENIDWEEIINMLSEDNQEEYYNLVNKNGGY